MKLQIHRTITVIEDVECESIEACLNSLSTLSVLKDNSPLNEFQTCGILIYDEDDEEVYNDYY